MNVIAFINKPTTKVKVGFSPGQFSVVLTPPFTRMLIFVKVVPQNQYIGYTCISFIYVSDIV
ncbi:MAG: hypothetical protein JWR02_2068 [Mucilaginibacter sp.]|nr:hypothetical protein [Mucilaginibacter sp.]